MNADVRRSIGAVAVLAAVLVAGCGSQPTRSQPAEPVAPPPTVLQVPSTLSPGSGLVALGFASNTGGLDNLFIYWTGLDVRRVDDGRRYEVGVTRKGLIGSVVFLGELPPGEYRAEQAVATELGNPFVIPLNNWGSTFRVDAARLTNLGTLVFQPESNKAIVKGSTYYLGLERNTGELGRYLRSTSPQLVAAVTGTSLEWSTIDGLEKRRELAATVRRVALGNYNVAAARDGTLYTTAQFGTVRRRDVDGRWSQVDTGNTRRMISVCALADGTVLAGGEAGLMLRSSDRGRSWRAITAPKAQLSVFDIGQLPNGTIYALSAADDDHVLVHVVDGSLKTAWRQVGDFTLPSTPAKVSFNHVPTAIAKVSNGKLMVFLPPQTVAVYVGGKTGWVARPIPVPFLEAAADRDNRLYIVAHKEAVAKNSRDMVMTSSDGGLRWNEAFSFNHTREAVLFSGTGLLYRISNNVVSESPYRTENRLSATPDTGKTWRDLGSFEFGYPRLVQTSGGTLLAVFTNLVYASDDAGANWHVEIEQFHPPAENQKRDANDRKEATKSIRYCASGECTDAAPPNAPRDAAVRNDS